jgi:hypothetical protein
MYYSKHMKNRKRRRRRNIAQCADKNTTRSRKLFIT